MARMRFLLSALMVACFLVGVGVRPQSVDSADAEGRPNILLMMADDLGFSDLGCYGSEIDTPHLDSLAEEGLRFTQFYNTGRCWPTRGSLLTGYYAQGIRRDKVPGVKSGNRGQRPDWAPLLCRPLSGSGYRTYHTGKWHLDGMPIQEGFDESYYLLDQQRFFSPQRHFQNDEKLAPVARDSDYYATIALGNHAVETLQAHFQNHTDRPFFHYLAFTAPHFPLHALSEDIQKYEDRYVVGWDEVRKQRYQRLLDLKMISSPMSRAMPNVGPPYDFPEAIQQLGAGETNCPLPWNELTPQQQRFQATKMAIHAAMIDRMDQQVGRVLEVLRQHSALENTLILFLSDNGASAEIMIRADGHDPDAPMGSADSHLCLGPGWSTACNTPLRYHKTWNHEGGTATPLIVHWPAKIHDGNQLRVQPGHVIDIWPTILDAAGMEEEQGPFARPGASLLPWILNDAYPEGSRELFWAHEDNAGFRKGDWKISRAGKESEWELFDLSRDRCETTNLAAEQPALLQQLKKAWQQTMQQQIKMAQ